MTSIYANPRWISERPTAMQDVALLFAGWIGDAATRTRRGRAADGVAAVAEAAAPCARADDAERRLAA